MATKKLTLKLLVDTKHEKVLFGEASKDVVDFLFNLLQLPLGTVVRLLTKEGVVGSLGNLYKSVENLDDTYLLPNQVKDVLLNPRTPVSSTAISGLLPPSSDGNVYGQTKIPKLYMCPTYGCRNRHTVTEEYNFPCSDCYRSNMTEEVKHIGKKEVTDSSSTSSCGAGFVKETVTYMVMDDLVIQPMSNVSSIALITQLNAKDGVALEEKVVALGMTEGIKLLKASLQSKMVLTTAFMKNMGSLEID